MQGSSATGRDVLLTFLILAFFIGAPVLFYFDQRLYPGHFLEHLPDHLLALVAIAAGIMAIYYERKLDKGFLEQKSEIKEIVDAVHTRYIGDWPEHISEILALVKDLRRGEELLVLVDFIGYAHYTKRELFMDYLNELQAARRRGVKLRFLLHSEKAMIRNLDAQFEKQKGDPHAARDLVQAYVDKYKNLIQKTGLEHYVDLVTAVLYVQARFCDLLLDAANDSPAAEIAASGEAESETVYYWIVRQGETPKTMIFAYSRFSGVGQGYGFRTADPRLMSIFYRDFERKWKSATLIKKGSDLVPDAWGKAQAWQEAKSAANQG